MRPPVRAAGSTAAAAGCKLLRRSDEPLRAAQQFLHQLRIPSGLRCVAVVEDEIRLFGLFRQLVDLPHPCHELALGVIVVVAQLVATPPPLGAPAVATAVTPPRSLLAVSHQWVAFLPWKRT